MPQDKRRYSEQDIQKGILDYLKLRHYVVFKHHSTGFGNREGKPVYFKYGDKGIADIIGCAPNGRFIAIEVKKKGNHPSEDQIKFLEKVRANRGIGFVAYSLEDVIRQIPPGTESASSSGKVQDDKKTT